jgi:hypothetical protein
LHAVGGFFFHFGEDVADDFGGVLGGFRGAGDLLCSAVISLCLESMVTWCRVEIGRMGLCVMYVCHVSLVWFAPSLVLTLRSNCTL